MKCRRELLNVEPPTQNALRGQLGVSEIFVVSMNVNVATKEHGAIFREGGNDAEELLFHGGVIALSRVELLREVSDGTALLLEHGAELIIAGVGINMKRFVQVGVSQVNILRNHGSDRVERLLMSGQPDEFLSARERRERRQESGAVRPHVFVKVDHPY